MRQKHVQNAAKAVQIALTTEATMGRGYCSVRGALSLRHRP
jgi:hypothetical protein